jgi:hypothetical protein
MIATLSINRILVLPELVRRKTVIKPLHYSQLDATHNLNFAGAQRRQLVLI